MNARGIHIYSRVASYVLLLGALSSTARAGNQELYVLPPLAAASEESCSTLRTTNGDGIQTGNFSGVYAMPSAASPIALTFASFQNHSGWSFQSYYKWSTTPWNGSGGLPTANCSGAACNGWKASFDGCLTASENCTTGGTSTSISEAQTVFGVTSGPFYLWVAIADEPNAKLSCGTGSQSCGGKACYDFANTVTSVQYTYPGGSITGVTPNNGTGQFPTGVFGAGTPGSHGDTSPEGVYPLNQAGSVKFSENQSGCLLVWMEQANGGDNPSKAQKLYGGCATPGDITIPFAFTNATPAGGKWRVLVQLLNKDSDASTEPVTASSPLLLDQWPKNANASNPYDFGNWATYFIGAQAAPTASATQVSISLAPLPGSFATLGSYGSPQYAFVPAAQATASPSPTCATLPSLTAFTPNNASGGTTIPIPIGDNYLFVCVKDSQNNWLPSAYPAATAAGNSIIDPTTFLPDFPIELRNTGTPPTFVSATPIKTDLGTTWDNSGVLGAGNGSGGVTMTVQDHSGEGISGSNPNNRWMWIPQSVAAAAGYGTDASLNPGDPGLQNFILSAAGGPYANSWGSNSSTPAGSGAQASVVVNPPYATLLNGHPQPDGAYLLAFTAYDNGGNPPLAYPVGYYQVDNTAPHACLRVWPANDPNGDTVNYCDSCQTSCAGSWSGVYHTDGASFTPAFNVPVGAEMLVNDNPNYPTDASCSSLAGEAYSGVSSALVTIAPTPAPAPPIAVPTPPNACTPSYALTPGSSIGTPGIHSSYTVDGTAFDRSVTAQKNTGILHWSFSVFPPSYLATNFQGTVLDATRIHYTWTAPPSQPASYRIVTFSSVDGSTEAFADDTTGSTSIPGTETSATIEFPHGNFHAYVELQAQDPANPGVYYPATIPNGTAYSELTTPAETALTGSLAPIAVWQSSATLTWTDENKTHAADIPNTDFFNTAKFFLPYPGAYGTEYQASYNNGAVVQTGCAPADPAASGTNDDSLVINTSADTISMNVFALKPNTGYSDVTVTPFNGPGNKGCSTVASPNPANTLSFYTIAVPPANVSFLSATSTSLTATISPQSDTALPSGPTYYLLLTDTHGTHYTSTPSRNTTQTITGLAAGQSYTLQACTFNADPAKRNIETDPQQCTAALNRGTGLPPPTSFTAIQTAPPSTPGSFALDIEGVSPAATCLVASFTFVSNGASYTVERTAGFAGPFTSQTVLFAGPIAPNSAIGFTNTAYDHIAIRVGSQGCQNNDPTLSDAITSASPLAIGYTTPNAPAVTSSTASTTLNTSTIQTTVAPSANTNPQDPAYTQYTAALVNLSNNATIVSPTTFKGTGGSISFTGLTPGQTYDVYAVGLSTSGLSVLNSSSTATHLIAPFAASELAWPHTVVYTDRIALQIAYPLAAPNPQPLCALLTFTPAGGTPTTQISKTTVADPLSALPDWVFAMPTPDTKYSDLHIQVGLTCASDDASLSVASPNPAAASPIFAWTTPTPPTITAAIAISGSQVNTTIGSGAGNPSTTKYGAAASTTTAATPIDPITFSTYSVLMPPTPQPISLINLTPGQQYEFFGEAISGSGLANLNVYSSPFGSTVRTPISAPTHITWLNTPGATIQTVAELSAKSIALGLTSANGNLNNVQPTCALLTYTTGFVTLQSVASAANATSPLVCTATECDGIFATPYADHQITVASVQFGNGSCGQGGVPDSSLSAPYTQTPDVIAWTRPEPPTFTLPLPEVAATNASITLRFSAPSDNPSYTSYDVIAQSIDANGNLGAVTDSTYTAIAGAIPASTQMTILLPKGGQYYELYARARSSSQLTPSLFEVLSSSSPSTLGSTAYTLPIQPTKVVLNPSLTTNHSFTMSITAAVSDTIFPPPYVQLRYSTKDASGNSQSGFVIVPSTPTIGGDGKPANPLIESITIPGATPNTGYTNLSIFVGGAPRLTNGSAPTQNDLTWSQPLSLQDTAYTLPNPPTSPPSSLNVLTVTNTAVTVSIAETGDGNPAATAYRLEADAASDHFSAAKYPFINSPYVRTDTSSGVTGLSAGLSYALRARAVSIYQPANPADPTQSYDQFSSLVSFGSNLNSGTILFVSSTSAIVQWTVPDTSDAIELLAGVLNPQGNKPAYETTDVTALTSPITSSITVSGLTPSNTSYVFSLLKIHPDQTQDKYLGTDTLVILHAAPPPAPGVHFAGTKEAVTLDVTMNSDLYNATDSLYGIEIDDGSGPKFLDGHGNYSTTPVLEPLSFWTAQAQVLGAEHVLQKTVYSVFVVVQDKNDGSLVPSPITTTNSPGQLSASFVFPNGTVSLDDYIFGVPQNAAFYATFTTDIDPATNFASFFKLTSQANPSTPVALSFTYDKPSRTVTIQPAALDPSSIYFLSVLPGIQDSFDIGVTTLTLTTQFVSGVDIVNPISPTVKVTSPYDTSRSNFILAQPGVFQARAYPVLRTTFIAPRNAVEPIGGAASNPGLGAFRPVEVLFYSASGNGPASGDIGAPVSLTLSNQGLPPNPNVDPRTYNIYYQGPGTNNLMPADGRLNPDGSVTAFITKSGLYFLAGPISLDVSGAHAYPVPFRPSSGDTVIHFKGVVPGATVRIYTIMGELVKELSSDGTNPLDWDVTNKHGESVASGVYVYQIKSAASEKRGKLIISR